MAVYFMRAGGSGPVKIGIAADVRRRIQGMRTGSPEELSLLAVFAGGAKLEADLHARFAGARLRGEWFRPIPEILEHAKLGAEAARLVLAGIGESDAYAGDEPEVRFSRRDPEALPIKKRALRAAMQRNGISSAELGRLLRQRGVEVSNHSVRSWANAAAKEPSTENFLFAAAAMNDREMANEFFRSCGLPEGMIQEAWRRHDLGGSELGRRLAEARGLAEQTLGLLS